MSVIPSSLSVNRHALPMAHAPWQPSPEASTETTWIARTARTAWIARTAKAWLHSQQHAVTAQSTAPLETQAQRRPSWCLGVSPQLRPGHSLLCPLSEGQSCSALGCRAQSGSRSLRRTHTHQQGSETHVHVSVILCMLLVATVCVHVCWYLSSSSLWPSRHQSV